MAEYLRNCRVHYFDKAQLGGVAVVIQERAELCESRSETAGRAAPPHTVDVDPSICGRELRSM